jgi:hypothetical protein
MSDHRTSDGEQPWNRSDVLTAIIIAVGFFQLGTFAWQGWQLKRSVDFAERHDKILERAYLWPGPGDHEPVQSGRRRFFITVHNTGKTVGIITDVHYQLSTKDEFDSGKFELKHYQRENVIPPDMAPGTQFRTGATVELIGKEPKILHGHICYTDVFKRPHKCFWKHWLLPDGNSDPLQGCYSEWD